MTTPFDRQRLPKEGEPHGWVQWKGTDVCMDFHCACGYHGHIDGTFVYYVRYPNCGATYFCNGHIELVKTIPTDDVSEDQVFVVY